MKAQLKRILNNMGIQPSEIIKAIPLYSLNAAIREAGYSKLIEQLRHIEPDLSEQYSTGKDTFDSYIELKLRGMHAFQCNLMLRALDFLEGEQLTIVDIGDSAGTHMRYLTGLVNSSKRELNTISVNLDSRAIEKIKARGQKAILCRAEDLDMGEQRVDLFVAFEMVEHLHNPSLFFHRLAVKSPCTRMLITVPYLRQSRVGLHNVRINNLESVHAETEHMFELSPEDWKLLMLHSGWRVTDEEIYYQYPVIWPFIRNFWRRYWTGFDVEGFWGAILVKDRTYADRYLDWEE